MVAVCSYMYNWQLRRQAEKRFRTGHPWVFSNELTKSPKGLPPGEPVLLTTEAGDFLAYGYGNPFSLIAFRCLSTHAEVKIDQNLFFERFKKAGDLRRRNGFLSASHRFVFAEGDFLPGLIIDRYLVADPEDHNRGISTKPAVAQVFVTQSSTAGMDFHKELWMAALKQYVEYENQNSLSNISWNQTAIISANSSGSRQLENIPVEGKMTIKSIDGYDFSNLKVLIESSFDSTPLVFSIDIIGGQKTGFFLDQRQNIRSLISLVQRSLPKNRPLRVLDLCCYVGQWSAQIAAFCTKQNVKSELHLFDASEEALKLASQNVHIQNGSPAPMKGDVLKSLSHVPDHFFDIVICDPPAFIKKKKDIPAGKQAYLKLNKEARKKVAAHGFYVSCSCSGALSAEDMKEILMRISHGTNHHTQWLAQGFHSPDHPQRLEFPEGSYLKCYIGWLSET